MCGFIVAGVGTDANDFFVRSRGPDAVGETTREELTFRHYLLHITGEKTPQPFVDGEVICLFNGEIYNQPFMKSDGEVLIPLYRQFGVDFAKHLDGEFAIALYDFGKRLALFATDSFGTKPLFVNGIQCASYPSAVPDGVRVPPNTTLVRHFSGRTEKSLTNFDFDFGHQSKETYDDWLSAFSRAVRKRAKPGCFITMSSGYDSGAIACELLRQEANFRSYSVRAGEDLEILQARVARTGGVLFHMTVDDYAQHTQFLRERVEPASFTLESGMTMHCDHLYHDAGAVGASFVFARARAEGHKIHLSGHGGDEITSDYSENPTISSLHGVYPKKLAPWRNFYGGCMRAYLTKEEHVAGAYGIETRYPLLDSQLVQEFLWLTPELKNKQFKAPLHEYLSRSDFPFRAGFKEGFGAMHSLTPDDDPRLPELLSWIKPRDPVAASDAP